MVFGRKKDLLDQMTQKMFEFANPLMNDIIRMEVGAPDPFEVQIFAWWVITNAAASRFGTTNIQKDLQIFQEYFLLQVEETYKKTGVISETFKEKLPNLSIKLLEVNDRYIKAAKIDFREQGVKWTEIGKLFAFRALPAASSDNQRRELASFVEENGSRWFWEIHAWYK